jgi:hypothetical protein
MGIFKQGLLQGNGSENFINGRVEFFADLPLASISTNEIYIVEKNSGIRFINKKWAGQYISNGAVWNRLGDLTNMLKSTDVIDDLTSTDTNKPLSANQGKVLQDGKESLFTKNTAFNKDFGSTSGTVAEGNDSRIIDSFQKSSDTLDDITAGATNKHFTVTDETKLDGIETGATADQTDSEIKTAYESNANTNAFTDDEKTKLTGIEAGATGDQTDAEIKTAYENNANTNAFTDAEKAKLTGIETGATADQTAGEIKTAYESNANTNAFTDADETKLDGIEAGATADQTKADIDALNINADTLDGVHASQLVTKVSSTDNAIVRFNGTGGDVQNSGLTVSDDASQVTLSNSTSTTFTSNKNLTLGQVGDQFGGTFLSLRNRHNENGAIFETTSLSVTLVDFVFRMGNGAQRNIRLEGRGSSGKHGANTWHIGGALASNPMMAIGDTAMSVGRLGNVAVGTITPTEKLTVAGNILATGNATINGSLSKGSGSFDIPHPNPEKKDTHRLRHYFVETPSAGGNIYKYQFECEEGENYFDLPDYYKFLNKDSLVWCNSFKHFGRAWGEVVENKKIKVITDSKGIYRILIFADRKDKIAMEEFNKYGIEYKLNK